MIFCKSKFRDSLQQGGLCSYECMFWSVIQHSTVTVCHFIPTSGSVQVSDTHTCFWLSMLWWMLVWKLIFNHVSFQGASPHIVSVVFLGLYTLCISKTALIARSKVCFSEFNRCAQTFSFLTQNLFSEQW